MQGNTVLGYAWDRCATAASTSGALSFDILRDKWEQIENEKRMIRARREVADIPPDPAGRTLSKRATTGATPLETAFLLDHRQLEESEKKTAPAYSQRVGRQAEKVAAERTGRTARESPGLAIGSEGTKSLAEASSRWSHCT
jgi:hypothetical protein